MIGAFLAGVATGILSGFGVGGGTLLLIYMTVWSGVPQTTAQGINLLYFLPTATMALPSHVKNGFIEKAAFLPAIFAGLIGTALGAWVATGLDVAQLHRYFGWFLIYVGVSEFFRKPSATPKDDSDDKPNIPPE